MSMINKSSYYIGGLIVAVLTVLIAIHIARASRRVFDFGLFRWESMGDNKSRIIINDGKGAIGPGVLSVGCKYPYLFGSCAEGNGDLCDRYFIMDIRSKNIEWFTEDKGFMMFERLGLSLVDCKGIGMFIASPDRKRLLQKLTNAVKGDSSCSHESP